MSVWGKITDCKTKQESLSSARFGSKKLITNQTRIIVKLLSVCFEDKSLIPKPDKTHHQVYVLKTNHWFQNQTRIIVKCVFGVKSLITEQNSHHFQVRVWRSKHWLQTRQESYSSVFIEDKSLIAKPDKNRRQVCVWGQITDYKTK